MAQVIYRAKIIQLLQLHYGILLDTTQQRPSIFTHLSQIAEQLWAGLKAKKTALHHQINNYHPDYLGQSLSTLSSIHFSLEAAQKCIAAEYGFETWKEIEALEHSQYDLLFEQALDAVLNGKTKQLKQLLDSDPYLAKATSPYGHQATLLHYTASNGVEMWRQQVPANLPEITKILLENEADKKAKMKVYGDNFSPFQLLENSAHPKEAGVYKEMSYLLS